MSRTPADPIRMCKEAAIKVSPGDHFYSPDLRGQVADLDSWRTGKSKHSSVKHKVDSST